MKKKISHVLILEGYRSIFPRTHGASKKRLTTDILSRPRFKACLSLDPPSQTTEPLASDPDKQLNRQADKPFLSWWPKTSTSSVCWTASPPHYEGCSSAIIPTFGCPLHTAHLGRRTIIPTTLGGSKTAHFVGKKPGCPGRVRALILYRIDRSWRSSL
jgi:hypothetical protein